MSIRLSLPPIRRPWPAEVSHALPGENIRVRLKGVEEEQVSKGWVLCPVKEPQAPCTRFKAQARRCATHTTEKVLGHLACS